MSVLSGTPDLWYLTYTPNFPSSITGNNLIESGGLTVMSSPPKFSVENQLLSSLPRLDHTRLLAHLKQVHYKQGQVLYEAGDSIRHVYFFMNGMASLLSSDEAGETLEVATVGNEGMVGIPAILRSNESPYQVVVQISADVMRMGVDKLCAEFNRGGQFHDLLLRYLSVWLNQMTQSAVCNRFHGLDQRLSRWLMVTRSHAQSNELHLTQEHISYALGVPRTSITASARRLKETGLISYERGKIQILNPRGLEDEACECYRTAVEGISRHHAA